MSKATSFVDAHRTPEVEMRSAKSPSKEDTCTAVVLTHVPQLQNCCQVLLVTCQVKTVGPDASTTQARALLYSASSTLFITEHLAQCLHLVHRNHSVKVNGISVTSN